AAFSPDGKLLLTGCGDPGKHKGEARLWETATGKLAGPPLPHHDAVTAVAFSPDGQAFLTASGDVPGVNPYLSLSAKPILYPNPYELVPRSPKVASDLMKDWTRGRVQLWQTGTRKALCRSLPHWGGVGSVAFSPDGRLVLSRDLGGRARLWDVA